MSSPITISERLDIQDGDVLLFRGNISEDAFNNFRKEFKRLHGDKRVAVVELREGQDLTKLSPEAMRAVGWVRANEAESGKAGFYHFTREMLADAYVAAEPPEATCETHDQLLAKVNAYLEDAKQCAEHGEQGGFMVPKPFATYVKELAAGKNPEPPNLDGLRTGYF